MNQRKVAQAYFVAVLGWILIFTMAISSGAVWTTDFDLIVQLRLPRVLLASSVGMGLSVAGAALQALFSNPLCEPYSLGISSGAALGAVIGISFGLQWIIAGIAGTAFAGAVLFAGLLYFVAQRNETQTITLLLTGIMLGFFGTSLVALCVALTDSNGIQGTLGWIFGDLSRARLQGALFSVVGVLSLVFSIWGCGGQLDALLLGEEGAMARGVDIKEVRKKVILYTSLLIGLCVSGAGMIGFVGLIVPHFTRKWVGSLHRNLIPLCALWGGNTLMLADWASRTVVRPYEMPVGIMTALMGAPLFLWILLKHREKV